jgi:hypothetical protein
VKKNTTAQIRRVLRNAFNLIHGSDEDEVNAIVRETENAVRRALDEGITVELSPRPAALRQLQHRIASRHRVVAESQGSEPLRHLVIYPHAFAALSDDQVY